MTGEEILQSDPEESCTAIWSVVTLSPAAAQEATENTTMDELRERLVKDYAPLFSGLANKNSPDRGRFGNARIKLRPHSKVYRHREYQLQGERAEAMKKLLKEFIERGCIEPSDRESASPAFIVPRKEKRIFAVLDLQHVYLQMALHEESRACTAMSRTLSTMQWKVVPTGAKNGNLVFQRMMEDLLGPVRDCADPLVRDIILDLARRTCRRMN